MYPCPYLCLYYIAHPEKTEKSAIKKSARFGELAENVNLNLQLMIFAFNGFKVDLFAVILLLALTLCLILICAHCTGWPIRFL